MVSYENLLSRLVEIAADVRRVDPSMVKVGQELLDIAANVRVFLAEHGYAQPERRALIEDGPEGPRLVCPCCKKPGPWRAAWWVPSTSGESEVDFEERMITPDYDDGEVHWDGSTPNTLECRECNQIVGLPDDSWILE